MTLLDFFWAIETAGGASSVPEMHETTFNIHMGRIPDRDQFGPLHRSWRSLVAHHAARQLQVMSGVFRAWRRADALGGCMYYCTGVALPAGIRMYMCSG